MTKDEWYTQLFERLDNSKFRSGFHLKEKDREYVREKGLETIRQHARDFIAKREAPAVIPNDGKQTPMRGHPVFIAAACYSNLLSGMYPKVAQDAAGKRTKPDSAGVSCGCDYDLDSERDGRR